MTVTPSLHPLLLGLLLLGMAVGRLLRAVDAPAHDSSHYFSTLSSIFSHRHQIPGINFRFLFLHYGPTDHGDLAPLRSSSIATPAALQRDPTATTTTRPWLPTTYRPSDPPAPLPSSKPPVRSSDSVAGHQTVKWWIPPVEQWGSPPTYSYSYIPTHLPIAFHDQPTDPPPLRSSDPMTQWQGITQ